MLTKRKSIKSIRSWMFITLDLSIIANVSTLCFRKYTQWPKQHRNLSPTIEMLLPQFPPFTNNRLNHIKGQSNARGGVLVRDASAFICQWCMVVHKLYATVYYQYYIKLNTSQLHHVHEFSYCCRCTNQYAVVAVTTWEITLGNYLQLLSYCGKLHDYFRYLGWKRVYILRYWTTKPRYIIGNLLFLYLIVII